jgi:NADH-quinone oxidoreductase subunit N
MYYYLRVVVAMYFKEPVQPHEPYLAPSMRLALAVTVIAVLGMGVLPGTVVEWAGGAATATGSPAALLVRP